MKRLNGMDAMLLHSETPTLHTHTLKVAIVDAADYTGVFDFAVFRRTVEERLHLLEPLRYRLLETPGRLHHPMWLQDCDHLHQAGALPVLINDAATGFARLRRRQRERRDRVRLAKPFAAPTTFVNHVVSSGRTFATATLALAQVKETAKRLAATVPGCDDGRDGEPVVGHEVERAREQSWCLLVQAAGMPRE